MARRLVVMLAFAASACGASADRPTTPDPRAGRAAAPAPRAQERASEPVASDGRAAALAAAMEHRLTLGLRADGSRVFPRHCRDAPGGCQARLGAFARLIASAAARHGLDPFLLAGMAMRESSFDPSAVGAVGEAGIVQLHPRGEGHDVRFVQDTRYRRRCLERVDACQGPVVDRAAEVLARSTQQCGSLTRALARYATGSCERGLPRVFRVLEERDRLLAAAADPQR